MTPDLEDALDGLTAATNYAESIDEDDLAKEIGHLYQQLAEAAPDEDWSDEDD